MAQGEFRRYYQKDDEKSYSEMSAGEISDLVHFKASEYQAKHDLDYETALDRILKNDAELCNWYVKGEPIMMTKEYSNASDGDRAMVELDRQAKKKLFDLDVSYSKAFSLIIEDPENKQLLRAYIDRNL